MITMGGATSSIYIQGDILLPKGINNLPSNGTAHCYLWSNATGYSIYIGGASGGTTVLHSKYTYVDGIEYRCHPVGRFETVLQADTIQALNSDSTSTISLYTISTNITIGHQFTQLLIPGTIVNAGFNAIIYDLSNNFYMMNNSIISLQNNFVILSASNNDILNDISLHGMRLNTIENNFYKTASVAYTWFQTVTQEIYYGLQCTTNQYIGNPSFGKVYITSPNTQIDSTLQINGLVTTNNDINFGIGK
jgi:hypothetical protein